MKDLTLQQLVAIQQMMNRFDDNGWLKQKLDTMVMFLEENNTKEAFRIANLINNKMK